MPRADTGTVRRCGALRGWGGRRARGRYSSLSLREASGGEPCPRAGASSAVINLTRSRAARKVAELHFVIPSGHLASNLGIGISGRELSRSETCPRQLGPLEFLLKGGDRD